MAISRHILSQIIEARTLEMFEMLNHEIETSGFRDLISSGIVLTGGTSSLRGMAALAEEIFKCRFGSAHQRASPGWSMW